MANMVNSFYINKKSFIKFVTKSINDWKDIMQCTCHFISMVRKDKDLQYLGKCRQNIVGCRFLVLLGLHQWSLGDSSDFCKTKKFWS